MPGHQQRAGLLGQARDHQRPAAEQHHHDRLAGGGDGIHQLLLAAGQAQLCARARLAAHVGAFANHQHHHVGSLGRRHRRRQIQPLIALDRAALNIGRLLIAKHGPQAIAHALDILGPPV